MRMRLCARGDVIEFPRKPLVMGIVNLSPDSFSGDGVEGVDRAIQYAEQQIADGADWIDLGAESARTNRAAISEQEEIDRFCKFIERWNCLGYANWLSINTWRPAVAKAVLAVGGALLNDIGGLPTDENARICRDVGVALLVMHSVGLPKVPHTHVGWDNVMESLTKFFSEKLAMTDAVGLPRDAIVLDPGIDFAKQKEDNLRIYRELSKLSCFERPVLLPVSRKTVIGECLGIADAAERDAGTIACIVQGVIQGAQIFRVHNVKAAVQTIAMLRAIEEGS